MEGKVLAILKLFAGKKQVSRNPAPPPPPPPKKLNFLLVYYIYFKFSGSDRECSFRFAITSPWNLVNGSEHAVNTETPNQLPMTCSKVYPQGNKNLQQQCKREDLSLYNVGRSLSKVLRGQWPSLFCNAAKLKSVPKVRNSVVYYVDWGSLFFS